MFRNVRQLLADAFYGNPHFPYPEYNFARLFVAIGYIFWGTFLWFPGEKLGQWDYWLLWLFFDEHVVGACFTIAGLVIAWRVLERKKPTILCEWFQAGIAAQWWILVLIPITSYGQVMSSIFGELLVAIVATFTYVNTQIHKTRS